MAGRIKIGTSGWHYKHWLGTFYPARTPASKMLAYYCEHFDTVELNNTFYRLPTRKGLEDWREGTPAHFCFAAKGSRYLTHMKKLKDPEPGLARFFDAVETLEHKLGPILFQLPPNWELNLERFEVFLKALPSNHRYAFEFRNPSWDAPDAYQLMAKHRIGYCIFDLAGYQSPVQATSDLVYLRLHGPGGKYEGSYSDSALAKWAKTLQSWRSEGKQIYVYFDNDQAGYAPKDALRLKEYIENH